MKSILLKIGYFLLEVGAGILMNVIFGKQNRQRLEAIVKELSIDSELTAKQKYNRAKKFLDEVASDAPDVAKNVAIEAVVAKVTEKSNAFIKKI